MKSIRVATMFMWDTEGEDQKCVDLLDKLWDAATAANNTETFSQWEGTYGTIRQVFLSVAATIFENAAYPGNASPGSMAIRLWELCVENGESPSWQLSHNASDIAGFE